MNNIYITFII